MQNKDLTKTKEEISKNDALEDVRRFAQQAVSIEDSPQSITNDTSRFLQQMKDGNDKEKRQALRSLQKQSEKLAMVMGLDNHYHLAGAVSKKYRPLLLNTVEQIIKEYECNTAIEKTTAEIIALAHIQVINDQKRLNSLINSLDEVDDSSTRYVAFLSKQLDRSYRHYLSAVITLRQLKQPNMEVTIKTNNAFVAQNQQINNDHNSHENI